MFDKEAIEKLSQAEAISAANESLSLGITQTDGPTACALPSDFNLHDLEKFQQCRRRARGTMTTSSVPAFAEYVKTHAEVGTTCFIEQDKMNAVAVLNLGDPAVPGHADNRAVLVPKQTAAYLSLKNVAHGRGITQKEAAEFLEDWPGMAECFNDADKLTVPKAIAAIRKITIEGLKKLESAEQSLSASKSTFESVTASSTETLPTFIYFKCVPFHGLAERTFVLRLGILTGGAAPAIALRVINAEQHDEEMAAELAQLVTAAIGDAAPVLVGAYSVAA